MPAGICNLREFVFRNMFNDREEGYDIKAITGAKVMWESPREQRIVFTFNGSGEDRINADPRSDMWTEKT